MDESLSYL